MSNIRKVTKSDKAKPLGGDFNSSDIAFLCYSFDKWELKTNNVVKAHSIGYRKQDHDKGKLELIEYGESIGLRVFEV